MSPGRGRKVSEEGAVHVEVYFHGLYGASGKGDFFLEPIMTVSRWATTKHLAPVFNIPVIYGSPLSSLVLLLFCLGYHMLQCLSFLQFRDGRARTERLEPMGSKALNPQDLSPGDFRALSLLHVVPTQWGAEAR